MKLSPNVSACMPPTKPTDNAPFSERDPARYGDMFVAWKNIKLILTSN